MIAHLAVVEDPAVRSNPVRFEDLRRKTLIGRDLAEHLDIPIDEDDVDTVGGLFVKNFGRFPETGDVVEVSGLQLTADRVERRRKRLITVTARIVDVP